MISSSPGGPKPAGVTTEDLYVALTSQPFPVRGWHLSVSHATGKEKVYPVYKLGTVERDDDGIPVDTPDVLFYVASTEILLTADFRLEACKVLGGQAWTCPPEAAQKQQLRFANTNGRLVLTLDTGAVPPYQKRGLYPDQKSWCDLTAHWSAVWERSGKTDPAAASVLAQLKAIRDAANNMLAQLLASLVHDIETHVPDYWLFAELLMAGQLEETILDQVVQHIPGVLTVEYQQRPLTQPSASTQ